MSLIHEDHITQAVIASHAGAEDARLRDVMTSLVQHLHAFAREVRLTDDEWRAGLRFLQAAGGAAVATAADHDDGPEREPGGELAALSDALGLTMLVASLNRPPAGGSAARAAWSAPLPPPATAAAQGPVVQLLRAMGRQA